MIKPMQAKIAKGKVGCRMRTEVLSAEDRPEEAIAVGFYLSLGGIIRRALAYRLEAVAHKAGGLGSARTNGESVLSTGWLRGRSG